MSAPDLKAAREFLAALTAADGWTTPVTFQTFADASEDAGLARILHGSLARRAAALEAMNDARAGIFITVNETNLRGRRGSDIVRPRALFIDCDGPLGRRLALRPSIIVKTPAGGHVYWLLAPGEELQRFHAAQQQLASYFGSDPAVCDISRVLRLPGFLHRKKAPVPVAMHRLRPDLRYTIDEVIAAHPGAAPVPERRSESCERSPTCAGILFRRWAHAAPLTRGTRNTVAFRIAIEGFRGGIAPAAVEQEVRAYCARAGIPNEAGAVLESARRCTRHCTRRSRRSS